MKVALTRARVFLLGLTLCLLVATAGSGVAQARHDTTSRREAPIIIKLAMTPTATSPWVVALKTVANIVNFKTNGNVQIQVFPSGQLGSQTDILSELKTNTVQMYLQNPPVTSSLDPQIGIFSAPNLFSSPKGDLLAWKSPLGQQIASHFNKVTGIRLLPPWQIGGWQIMTADKPVRRCQDLAGMKLRVPPSPVLSAYMQACGATPISMTFSEVFLALKTHTIDGMPQVLGNVPGSNLQQVLKYVTVINGIYDFFNPMINDQTWNALTPSEQKILVSAFGSGRLLSDKLLNQAETTGKNVMTAEGGQVITPTASELATWVKAGQKVWAQFAVEWGGMAKVKALKAAGTPPVKK